jgi:methionine-rich copper-binding protein CopC
MTNLPSQIIRALLLFFGSLLLLFGAWELLAPRARYVSSHPAPGAALAAPPQEVLVSFSNELTPESNISVTSTVTLSPSGEKEYSGGKRFTATGPDPRDPQRRTLRVELEPGEPAGLYWVQWKAVAARGKSQRFGRLCFGAGMTVPDHITRDMPGALREWNYRWRERRAALLGGLLLVALGVVLPRLPLRGWR